MHTHAIFLTDFAPQKVGYPAMYIILNHFLDNEYSVIYCVESTPSSRIVKNMQSAGIGDLKHVVKEGALQIINRDIFYSHNEDKKMNRKSKKDISNNKRKKNSSSPITEEQVFQKFRLMFNEARDKSDFRRKKVIYFGYPPTPYHAPGGFERLLYNEQAIERFKQRTSLEIVCCYDISIISHMTLWQAISTLNAHNKIFHIGGDYDDIWRSSDILHLIEIGIEKSLGKGSFDLVLSTLKLVYGIDERKIVQDPQKLEKIITRVIGKNSDLVTKSIKSEIENRLI